MVKSLAATGLRYNDIAALVREGISIPTLTKYFKPELRLGSAEANANVAEALYKRAIGGNISSADLVDQSQDGLEGGQG